MSALNGGRTYQRRGALGTAASALDKALWLHGFRYATTGGGCDGFERVLADDSYLLVTGVSTEADPEGICRAPDAFPVTVGGADAHGRDIGCQTVTTLPEFGAAVAHYLNTLKGV